MFTKYDGTPVELVEVTKKRSSDNQFAPVITTVTFTDFDGTTLTVETNSPAFVGAFNTPGEKFRFILHPKVSNLIEPKKEEKTSGA